VPQPSSTPLWAGMGPVVVWWNLPMILKITGAKPAAKTALENYPVGVPPDGWSA